MHPSNPTMVPIYSVWPLSDSVSRLVHCSEVTRCNQSFRMTDSLLAIRFSDSTTFDELTGPLTPIRKEWFRFRKFCCHEEYRILTCKTPTETIRSLRKLESLKRNSDSPLRRRMKLCEAKTLRRYCLRVCLTIYEPKINVYNSMSSSPTG